MEIRIETETLSLWLAVCILSSLATSGVRVKCKDALEMCSSVSGCKMGMSNYQRNCRDVMEGEINYCSTKCRESLVALIIAGKLTSNSSIFIVDIYIYIYVYIYIYNILYYLIRYYLLLFIIDMICNCIIS